MRSGSWKLIEWYEDGKIELFNLGNDVGESKDLVEVEAKRAGELHAKLKAWRGDAGVRMSTPNPRFNPKKAAWK